MVTVDLLEETPADVTDPLLWRDAQLMLNRHAGPDRYGLCVWCGRSWSCAPRRLAERAAAAARKPWREAWTARHDLVGMRDLPEWRSTEVPEWRDRDLVQWRDRDVAEWRDRDLVQWRDRDVAFESEVGKQGGHLPGVVGVNAGASNSRGAWAGRDRRPAPRF